MLQRSGLWDDVSTHRDLNGKERATSAVLAGPARPLTGHPRSDERIGQ
jgi:release factor glutamine methyltransferase